MEDLKSIKVDATKMYDEERVPKIEVPRVTWWKDPGLRTLYCMMPILFMGSTINGYDGSLLNGLQTMDPWQEYFDHPTSARLGLFTAIQNIGGFVALFFSSYAADLFGRRIGVAIGVVIILVGTIIQVVPSVNSGMFIGGRFLVGFGSNLSQGSAPLLVMELAHPAHRGKLTTMYNTLWYVGSIVAAWTVYGTVKYTSDAAWRIPVGVQAAMPVMQLVGIWFLPESPRWLCAKDRSDEAFQVLVKYHANNDAHSAFVEQELFEIQETIRLEQLSSNNSWLDLVRTPGNRKRLLLIILTAFFSQCSGNGLVSYYIHDILTSVGVHDASDQSIINGGLQIWSFLVAVLFSVLLVDRLGRRTLFLTAGVGMLITFSVWTGGRRRRHRHDLRLLRRGGLRVAGAHRLLLRRDPALPHPRQGARCHHGRHGGQLRLQPVRQPDRPGGAGVEVLLRLHRYPRARVPGHLLPVRRDQGPDARGDREAVRRRRRGRRGQGRDDGCGCCGREEGEGRGREGEGCGCRGRACGGGVNGGTWKAVV
ncbi:General substrate transporter [Macrophomina phaseolina MS6]|uniref:General substrate transporter n=1 Tax=Macrophomina phaseolina (strain MS6) TaxID=1126212 RepID=K2R4Z5_MACPH|nr:General substrate transporter [Macrophomina phaseolina MS6]